MQSFAMFLGLALFLAQGTQAPGLPCPVGFLLPAFYVALCSLASALLAVVCGFSALWLDVVNGFSAPFNFWDGNLPSPTF